MSAQLRRLWRRWRYCAIGEHRETAEVTGGSVLQLRCVDCGVHRALGWVYCNVTNKPRHSWERPDA